MAGSLLADKIKNVFQKLVFWQDNMIYTTSSDGSTDDAVTTINNNISLGGTVTATTQSADDNTNKLATTAYVDAAVDTKDTLGELSGTLDDITDGSTYVKSTNDYTDSEKSKLTGISPNAEVNVNPDWNAVSGDAQILNKPNVQYTSAIPEATSSQTGLATSTQIGKLDGIEALADVTDTANVTSAGALLKDGSVTMTGDLLTGGNNITLATGNINSLGSLTFNTDAGLPISRVRDEDNMASNETTSLATQQSIKAYADTMLPLAGGTMSGNIDFNNTARVLNANRISFGASAAEGYINGIKDEDDMSSNSSQHVPTQQSAKAYIDARQETSIISNGFYFNSNTALDTFFRDANDSAQMFNMNVFDGEYGTSVGDTISVSTAIAVSGYVIPEACNLKTVAWNTYQAYPVSGRAVFQLWTIDDPESSLTATLRTTEMLTSNRVIVTSIQTSNEALSQGAVVIPGIRFVSGTSSYWYGNFSIQTTKTVD